MMSVDVTVVIPTLNSEKTLESCLASVMSQQWGRGKLEVIVADGGSEDRTLDIARRYGAIVVANRLRTGEAGKAAGIRESSAPFIALIDSDNVLVSPQWIETMLSPMLSDSGIIASEPLEYSWREGDPNLVRYFAMLGMNDPLCLFIGNYDRYSVFTGRWTDLPVRAIDRGSFLEVELEPDSMLPTIGANGTIIRRSALENVKWEPYYMDTDIFAQLAKLGGARVAKVKCGIVHLYCDELKDFARKQDRRIRDFFFFSGRGMRFHAWRKNNRLICGIIWFVASTLLLLPLLWQIRHALRVRRDRAIWLHVPVCWVTLWVYGKVAVMRWLGLISGPAKRVEWNR